MKTSQYIFSLFLLTLIFHACSSSRAVFSPVEKYGFSSKTKANNSPHVKKMIEEWQGRKDNAPIKLVLPKGEYHFYEEGAYICEYYISNHDQDPSKTVGFALENLKNIEIDGQGSTFIFHGRMIPFAIRNSENITLKNLKIDFETPALRQLEILKVNKEKNELTAEIYPKDHYRVENNQLILEGEGYEVSPTNAMAFTPDKRLTYGRQDLPFYPKHVEKTGKNILRIRDWDPIAKANAGERLVLRSPFRPTPGIFIDQSKNTTIDHVTVHYAEGMGLLAQMSENITLDGFSVAFKNDEDPRFFTTQADATHFSAIKGKIISQNGKYENMADDAINVHGTYLRISKRIDDHTILARYMHPQTWGFKWGEKGDEIQFLRSKNMEKTHSEVFHISDIKAMDTPTAHGAKEFKIIFDKEIPAEINSDDTHAIENLTWTPEVVFENNLIRNNRARGSLFSTPKKVTVEKNVFDHTHGSAILLAGDANGWFETGMSENVSIRKNIFINALTGSYQFTNAIISIYPEIPDLENQKTFFHKNVVMEDNIFETFDRPLVYAKSIDGLIFRKNTVKATSDFPPFHWNTHSFFLEKANNIRIENNDFQYGFDPQKDIRVKLSGPDAVKYTP